MRRIDCLAFALSFSYGLGGIAHGAPVRGTGTAHGGNGKIMIKSGSEVSTQELRYLLIWEVVLKSGKLAVKTGRWKYL